MTYSEEFVRDTEFFFADSAGINIGQKLFHLFLRRKIAWIECEFSLEDEGIGGQRVLHKVDEVLRRYD